MRQLFLTGFYKPKRSEIKKHALPEESVNDLWRERMKQKFIFWPTAYGVKTKKGQWLFIDDIPIRFTDKRRAEEAFRTHPDAYQLIGELDPLLDEEPGVVLETKK